MKTLMLISIALIGLSILFNRREGAAADVLMFAGYAVMAYVVWVVLP